MNGFIWGCWAACLCQHSILLPVMVTTGIHPAVGSSAPVSNQTHPCEGWWGNKNATQYVFFWKMEKDLGKSQELQCIYLILDKGFFSNKLLCDYKRSDLLWCLLIEGMDNIGLHIWKLPSTSCMAVGKPFTFLRLSINIYKMRCSWTNYFKFLSGSKDSTSFEWGLESYHQGKGKESILTCMGETTSSMTLGKLPNLSVLQLSKH